MRELPRGRAARTWMLFGSLLMGAVVVVPSAHAFEPRWGAWSALVAWSTCVASGLVACGLIQRVAGPHNVMLQVCAALATRTGIPLAVCMVIYLQVPVLADAGFVYYLLIFYFVTLVTMTMWQVADIPVRVPLRAAAETKAHGSEHG